MLYTMGNILYQHNINLKMKQNKEHNVLTNYYNHRIQKYNNTYNQFSHELSFFLDSYDESESLSKRQFNSIVQNYTRKINKNVFDIELSLIGTRNLFNTLVKEYNKVITNNDSSSELFINTRTIDKEQKTFIYIDLCFDVLRQIYENSVFTKNEELTNKTESIMIDLKNYTSQLIMNGGI